MLTAGIILGVLTVITAAVMRQRTQAANRSATMAEAAVHGLLGVATFVVLYLAAR